MYSLIEIDGPFWSKRLEEVRNPPTSIGVGHGRKANEGTSSSESRIMCLRIFYLLFSVNLPLCYLLKKSSRLSSTGNPSPVSVSDSLWRSQHCLCSGHLPHLCLPPRCTFLFLSLQLHWSFTSKSRRIYVNLVFQDKTMVEDKAVDDKYNLEAAEILACEAQVPFS